MGIKGRFSSSQLLINMASGAFVTAISFAITMFSYPLYLHYLGYESYGIWLVLSTVLSFAQLGNLGINAAVAKIIAEEHGRNDKVAIQQVLSVAVTSLLVSGLVVVLTVFLMRGPITSLFKLDPRNAAMVKWLLPYIGLLSVYVFIVEVCNATLSGLGRMDLANSAQVLGRLAAITVSALLLHLGHGVSSLLIGNFLCYLVVHAQTLFHVKRILRSRIILPGYFNRQVFQRVMRVGGFMSASSVLVMLFDPFNKMMMSRYAGLSLVPVYDLAYRGSMQLRGVIESALRAIMPEVSRLSARPDQDSYVTIARLNAKAVRLILLSGVVIFLPLALFCDPLLQAWLAKSFNTAIPWAFRMCVGTVFVSLIAVPSYYTLLGLGRVHHLTISHLIQSGSNALLAVLIASLAPQAFFHGLLVAILFAVTASSTYLLFNFRKEMARLNRRAESGMSGSETCVAGNAAF